MSLYFTREHEWIRVDGDIATVGISDHAQEALGDIVFAEVPAAGKQLAKGDDAAVVESVKAASDVYAPVGGEVTEGNAEIADDPALINRDPEGAGWFFKLKLADPGELDGLMDEAVVSRMGEDALSDAPASKDSGASTSQWDAADYAAHRRLRARARAGGAGPARPAAGRTYSRRRLRRRHADAEDQGNGRGCCRDRQQPEHGRRRQGQGARCAADGRGPAEVRARRSMRLFPTLRCTGCSTRSGRRGRSGSR